MNIKALFVVLLLLPSSAWTQGVRSDQTAQDLFQFYTKNFIQSPGPMSEFDIFKDGTVFHGFINLGGTSATITTDSVALAQNIANTATLFFGIPGDYRWTVRQGGFFERKPVETIDTWKSVILDLTIDGVPLENAYTDIMLDDQGRLRRLTISLPRLRPDIVASVRGTLLTPEAAQARIRTDANALPAGNLFNITPNAPLTFVDFRKIAIAREPYVLYMATVNRAWYTVNAKTGAVSKVSTMK
jgi:hypothetical protein